MEMDELDKNFRGEKKRREEKRKGQGSLES
jgi:hypothetical protein